MEFLWAAISVCWTLGAWFIGRASWTMARSWAEAGVANNGAGLELWRDTNPLGFAVALWGTRLIGVLAFLFVAIGIAITFGWISRAL